MASGTRSFVRLIQRILVVAALPALLVSGPGCGGGGDDEAVEEKPKSALVPGALDDTLHTPADTSAWYQMGGTQAEESGLTPSSEATEVPADAEASAAQAQPSPSSVAPPSQGGYILQLGSFRDVANARRQADRLREAGHSPSIEKSDLGGQTYHRVILTGLPDQSAASALGERIHAELDITYLVREAR